MPQCLLALQLCNALDGTSNDQVLPCAQFTQLPEHGLGLLEVIGLNHPALALQGEQVLWPQLGHHPLTPGHGGNLRGQGELPVPAPTIERLQLPDGVLWRVTYAGMVKEHRQDWQAWCWYEMACAAYAVQSRLGQDRPTS